MGSRLLKSLLGLSFVTVLGLSVQASQVSNFTGDGLRSCGNEGEEPCGFFERDRFNEACDSGLAVADRICGCRLRGPFGGCLFWRRCETCENNTRHRSTTTTNFSNSWANWALRNQREQLALDEPIELGDAFGDPQCLQQLQ